ncbi:ABC transporter ATP-binding protein [Bradyrhizobium sp. G127]|jgi:branched-chain amino acid transport system ATP-binding protein|uniref:ABC transporter ATP-binding protein n=1 Tax=Bradyrhizobium sp. G127 TaxID=2904800 RepID=UPI001F213318|nr:ABC transporter ATP-binding protein [Bradyrhizobium sp. G127]MCF2522704.1 ABC transporter ATP-binding protein [Bradyrhizobium sp. G127]
MFSIDNLQVHYGLSHIIQGVSIDAQPGEVVGIFGRNGVGKTTLMKTIAGWVAPSGGTITLDGTRLDGLTPDGVCRHGVGFVPEDRRIFPGLSVEENLKLGLMQRAGRSRAEENAEIDRIYQRMPRLAERRRQAGTTLSGGEQQMLAMARVMVGRPRLALIDEPSEGLAPMIVADIFAIIEEMKAGGATILLVEQNVHAALAVADRFYAIERGAVVVTGNAKDSSDKARLLEAIAV